jgi:periplasmic copper chaperone A
VTDAVRHVRPLAISLCLAVAPLVAGCGAGLNDATSHERTTPYAANASLGPLRIRDATIVPTGSAPGVEAYLTVVIVNTGTAPDQLTAATVDGNAVTPTADGSATPASVSPTSFSVLPTHPLSLGDPDLNGTGISLAITATPDRLIVGTSWPVTFSFANAGTVSLQVPVKDLTELTSG